jgi:signal peptide peptidase SppA
MSDAAHRIDRIIAAFADTIWGIRAAKLAVMVSLLTLRANGQRQHRDEVRAALGTSVAASAVRGVARGVAVVFANGVLGPRMNQMLEISGGTSTEMLARDVGALMADDRVSAVVLAVDSPGGNCHGLTDAATAIRAARGPKPLIGVASHQAASAACVLLAQCDRVYASPSADVGSLGVYTVHEDLSAAQEKLGVKTTFVSAGRYKTEGHPFAPLSDEARAALQRRVTQTYDRLIADVAAGRGVSEATVREGYGEGRLLTARDARAAGLVDDIATLDEVVTDLASTQSARATRAPRDAARRQEPAALDDWQRRVALDLRLLDL